jgi:hypothetical protein
MWMDARHYDGEWKNNMQDGMGTFKYKDGRIYVGEFKENKMQGYGCQSFSTNKKEY